MAISFVKPHSLLFYRPTISDELNQHDLMVIPKVPSGVSGTALAASLLRDGWSVCPTSCSSFFVFTYQVVAWHNSLHHQLAKIYEKYQEATDALLHERRGRRHAEAVLERVSYDACYFIWVLILCTIQYPHAIFFFSKGYQINFLPAIPFFSQSLIFQSVTQVGLMCHWDIDGK
jgi:hypothetical protein